MKKFILNMCMLLTISITPINFFAGNCNSRTTVIPVIHNQIINQTEAEEYPRQRARSMESYASWVVRREEPQNSQPTTYNSIEHNNLHVTIIYTGNQNLQLTRIYNGSDDDDEYLTEVRISQHNNQNR